MRKLAIGLLSLLMSLLAPWQASGAPVTWFSPFPEPLYLVEIGPESGPGVVEWRLVTVDHQLTAPEGAYAKRIGGEYKSRMDLELARNDLAGDGYTVNLNQIRIFDRDNNETGSFLLGAKPILITGPPKCSRATSTRISHRRARNSSPCPSTWKTISTM